MNASLRHTPLLLLLGAALLLGGCSSGPTSYYSRMKRTVTDAKDDLMGTRPTTAELFPEDQTPLIDINTDAADVMMGLIMSPINKNSPVYWERFTNRADMNDPAPFGALVSDQVAARLALKGFMLTEGPPRKAAPRPAPEPPLKPEALSTSGPDARAAEKRRKDELDAPRPCLLSGTYLIADKVVYVSARLTALDDGQVMSAHSWTVPVNRNTRALLPQLRQRGGLTPSVKTSLGASPHQIANPRGQPQNYVDRDLVR